MKGSDSEEAFSGSHRTAPRRAVPSSNTIVDGDSNSRSKNLRKTSDDGTLSRVLEETGLDKNASKDLGTVKAEIQGKPIVTR